MTTPSLSIYVIYSNIEKVVIKNTSTSQYVYYVLILNDFEGTIKFTSKTTPS